MTKAKHLRLERLERRDLRAAFNMPWPEIDSLSLSFVPDGTRAGDTSSDLFRSLEKVFPNDNWQLEVLRAFQTWAIESKANIALTDDHGQPIGTLGFKQGDVRFGDVRIGAFSMENDVLAVANPYDPFIANTWVGDIFLNNNESFLKNAKDPTQALFAIMLHESGHVFGIAHSFDPTSAMFPEFQETDPKLNKDDIASLQSLYGKRIADAWEGQAGNQTMGNASPIQFFDETYLSMSPEWRGDIGSLADIDNYQFQVPADAHLLDFHLKVQGISLLTARLSIVNAAGEVLATSTASDPRANDIEISLSDVQPGEQLYIRVESADSSVFGVGAYEMQVVPRSNSDSRPPPTGYSGFHEVTFANEELLATTLGYVEHTYYETEGTLSAAHNTQVFRVRSTDVDPKFLNVFTVVVDAENASIDQLLVTIMDVNGNIIPYTTIPNDGGSLALQVVGVASDTDYLISIATRELLPTKIGYELEVDFAQDGAHLETLVNESLDSKQPIFEQTYRVDHSGQYHFALAASDWSDPNESSLEMRIVDASGLKRFSTLVVDGATRTFDVFLDRGDYIVQFTSPNRNPSSQVAFQWSGITTSSPIGPQLRDTVREPIESTSATPLVTLSTYWLPGPLNSIGSTRFQVSITERPNVGNVERIATVDSLFIGRISATFPFEEDTSLKPENDRDSTSQSSFEVPKVSPVFPSKDSPLRVKEASSVKEKESDGATSPSNKATTDRHGQKGEFQIHIESNASLDNSDSAPSEDSVSSSPFEQLLRWAGNRQLPDFSFLAMLLGGFVLVGKRKRTQLPSAPMLPKATKLGKRRS